MSSGDSQIVYWNRARQREETEQVYGDRWVRWTYGTPSGRRLADHLFATRAPSLLYGAFQSSPLSRRKIAPFIREFGIVMEEFESGPFGSFNDFFVRRFRPGARTFERAPEIMPAFAEARYLGYESVAPGQPVPVKGATITPERLLGDERHARDFKDGPALIARLCPTDYHRFHFPDSGRSLESYTITGKLHSVNPLALRSRDGLFDQNERQVSVLETRNFGKLAYVEVGAMLVGRIVQTFGQTHAESRPFERGDEKGYFLFGASTVIVLGEKGRWRPVDDIRKQTSRGLEVLVRLGEPVAVQCK